MNAVGSFVANDLVPLHRRIQDRCKNAGSLAGVREDLQQLLRCDRHSFLQKGLDVQWRSEVCSVK